MISAATAGAMGICFTGCYLYFNRKRRSGFKLYDMVLKVRETCMRSTIVTNFPDFNDQKALEQFFIEELRKCFMSYMNECDIIKTINYGINALVACPHRRGLYILEKCLMESGTEILIEILKLKCQNIMSHSEDF